MSKRKEVLQRPAGDSRPANQTFMEMLDLNREEYEIRLALAKENIMLKGRIAELEAENARLRETAEKQRAILNNYSLAPDIHKLLRQLHEQILGVGDGK